MLAFNYSLFNYSVKASLIGDVFGTLRPTTCTSYVLFVTLHSVTMRQDIISIFLGKFYMFVNNPSSL